MSSANLNQSSSPLIKNGMDNSSTISGSTGFASFSSPSSSFCSTPATSNTVIKKEKINFKTLLESNCSNHKKAYQQKCLNCMAIFRYVTKFNGYNVIEWRTDIEEILNLTNYRECIERQPNPDNTNEMQKFNHVRNLLQMTIGQDFKNFAKQFDTPKSLFDWCVSHELKTMSRKYEILMDLFETGYYPTASGQLTAWITLFENKVKQLEELGCNLDEPVKAILLSHAMLPEKLWPTHNKFFAKETIDYDEFKKALIEADCYEDFILCKKNYLQKGFENENGEDYEECEDDEEEEEGEEQEDEEGEQEPEQQEQEEGQNENETAVKTVAAEVKVQPKNESKPIVSSSTNDNVSNANETSIDKFSSMVAIKDTLTEIMERIKTMSDLLNNYFLTITPATDAAILQSSSSSSTRINNWCNNCQKHGHNLLNCRFRKFYSNSSWCTYCRTKTHHTNNCWSRN